MRKILELDALSNLFSSLSLVFWACILSSFFSMLSTFFSIFLRAVVRALSVF